MRFALWLWAGIVAVAAVSAGVTWVWFAGEVSPWLVGLVVPSLVLVSVALVVACRG